MTITNKHGKWFGKVGAASGAVTTISEWVSSNQSIVDALTSVETALVPLIITVVSGGIGWVSHQLLVLEEREAERVAQIAALQAQSKSE